MGLDLDRLAAANTDRRLEWHGEQDDWTSADWGNATHGEIGELIEAVGNLLEVSRHMGLASDIIKKLRRHESGYADSERDIPVLKKEAGKEMADVVIYISLLANYLDINLSDAVIEKFNEVSEKRGFPQRL
jgi:NTP pyrophosphatase (non-canonical NTP hydrolase)